MSVEASEAVIGSIMLSPQALEDVTQVLAPSALPDARHELILETALRLTAQDRHVDVMTMAEALGSSLERVGGLPELNRLVSGVVTPENAGYWAEIVARESARRELDKIALRVHQAVIDNVDPLELMTTFRSELDRVSVPGAVTAVSFAQSMQDTLSALEKGHSGYIPTGWPDLDRLIHGWRPGALHVVGARPGQGKSILAAQTALTTSQSGKAAVIASMEMSAHELNIRLLAQTAQIGMDSLAKHSLSEMEWANVSAAVPGLLDAALFIDDRSHQSVTQIRAHARRVQQRMELGMIVVDYTQQIQVESHLQRAPRHEQVATISRDLKLLARELDVPVIALSQLNRASDNRIDRRPQMSDLRESGAIEADADVVILLHHDAPDAPELELLVRKARQGRTGDVRLAWQAHFARLMSSAPASAWGGGRDRAVGEAS